jgi:nucleosome binding factor SPN SPT16 subunit
LTGLVSQVDSSNIDGTFTIAGTVVPDPENFYKLGSEPYVYAPSDIDDEDEEEPEGDFDEDEGDYDDEEGDEE